MGMVVNDSAFDLNRNCYWYGVCVWAWFSLILCQICIEFVLGGGLCVGMVFK